MSRRFVVAVCWTSLLVLASPGVATGANAGGGAVAEKYDLADKCTNEVEAAWTSSPASAVRLLLSDTLSCVGRTRAEIEDKIARRLASIGPVDPRVTGAVRECVASLLAAWDQDPTAAITRALGPSICSAPVLARPVLLEIVRRDSALPQDRPWIRDVRDIDSGARDADRRWLLDAAMACNGGKWAGSGGVAFPLKNASEDMRTRIIEVEWSPPSTITVRAEHTSRSTAQGVFGSTVDCTPRLTVGGTTFEPASSECGANPFTKLNTDGSETRLALVPNGTPTTYAAVYSMTLDRYLAGAEYLDRTMGRVTTRFSVGLLPYGSTAPRCPLSATDLAGTARAFAISPVPSAPTSAPTVRLEPKAGKPEPGGGAPFKFQRLGPELVGPAPTRPTPRRQIYKSDRLPVVLATPRGSPSSVQSTDDGNAVAMDVVGLDMGVLVFDARTGSEIARCPIQSPYVLSRNGRFVVGSTVAGLALCDIRNNMAVQRLVDVAPATALALSPDGGFLAAGSADGAIRLWDLRSGEMVWRVEPSGQRVNHVALSSGGRRVAGVFRNSIVRCWDVEGGPMRETTVPAPERDTFVRLVAFLRNATQVLVGSDKASWLWSIVGQPGDVREFPLGAHAVAPDDNVIVGIGEYVRAGADSHTPLTLWSIVVGKPFAALRSSHIPGSVVFAGDGSTLYSATNGSGLEAWRFVKRP